METAPYQLGFRSLEEETPARPIAVEGDFPEWLCGSLLRTGPARFEVGEQSYRHWFDGLAMLHSFHFQSGRVTYANRFLRSSAYRHAMESGRIGYSEFATDPCQTLFERVRSRFRPKITDNGCVNVNRFADQYVAQTETRLPVRFDPRTLETLGVYDLDAAPGDPLPGPVLTPHPHFDAYRRKIYSYVIDFGITNRYRVFTIDAVNGIQQELAAIPVKQPSYMHSFAMTRRYIVLAEFPLVVNPLALKFSGRPFIENFRWQPQRGIRFSVIDKMTGNVVRQARGEAAFAFHHINAFESDGKVLVDMITYPDASVVQQFYLDRLRSADPTIAAGKPVRWRIELDRSTDASARPLSERNVELPRINYSRHAGRPYRCIFAVGESSRRDFLDQLTRLDLTLDSTSEWRESDCYPGEPVFVPHPTGSRESDGVVLSVVLDARRERSFLLCLDATSWQEQGRAEVPHHIPFGFHGNYYREIYPGH